MDIEQEMKYDRLYFGDRKEQRQVIHEVMRAVESGAGTLHLISGGTCTGKTSTLRMLQDRMNRHPQFHPVFLEDAPEKLRTLVQPLDKYVGDASLIYKHRLKPHYVVIPSGEWGPSNPDYFPKLQAMAELTAQLGQEGNQLSWIIDAPILGQAAPVFKLNRKRDKQAKADREAFVQAVAELQDKFAVASDHRLHYDHAEVRETLWSKIREYGNEFVDFLRTTSHWDDSPEWKKAYTAALQNDRAAYDRAFSMLELRVRAKERG